MVTTLRIAKWQFHFHTLNAIMAFALVVWLAVSAFVPEERQPSLFGEAFLVVLGAWLTYKAAEQKTAEQKTEKRVGALEDVAREAHPELSKENGGDNNANT